MGINIHMMIHLVEDVKLYGPLWTHNCFSFENANGLLLKCCHGSQYFLEQIGYHNLILNTVSMIENQMKFVENDNLQHLFEKLNSPLGQNFQ